jgi:ATP-dependent DNA helicase PIF1
MTERELIDFTFPNLLDENFDMLSLSNRIIVAPKNSKVDEINEIATNLMYGASSQHLSYDKVVKDSQQALYPTEFLNKLNVSGLPPHKLILKKGMPIIMLRNLNAIEGLCNGTRMIVKNIYSRLIDAEISFGSFAGKRVLIPKMPLIPSDTNLPFDFLRIQFPIRPSFCISINKSQGQTLDFISLWLGDDHVFSHGQLYVALSRVSSMKNIKIAISNDQKLTRNVVYTEVFSNLYKK